MREILFRIWNGTSYEYDVMVGKFGAFYVNPMNDGLDVDDSASLSPFNTKFSDDVVIEQFTSLVDRNGKRVFEGDIIKHNNTHFVVEFSANHLGFICIDRKHKTRGGFANWRDGNWMKNVSSYIQIIGNIHDNPELLEAKS